MAVCYCANAFQHCGPKKCVATVGTDSDEHYFGAHCQTT